MAEDAADKRPIRVAIVGGGFAGIAAAWSLAQQGNDEVHYEVHVFEKSWRLGGKAASSRSGDGRILTNGPLVWLGFYENAFRMMRECYDEFEEQKLGPSSKDPKKRLAHGRIEDAFFPEPNVGAGIRNPDVGGEASNTRDWAVWSAHLPPAKGLPGEPLDEASNPFTLASYLLRSFDLLKALMLSVIRAPDQDPHGEPRPDDRSQSDHVLDFDFSVDGTVSMKLAIERMAQLLRTGSLTGAAAWLQAVTILEVWMQDLNLGLQVGDSALTLAQAFAAQTRKFLRDFVKADPKLRVKTEIIDIVLTIAVGLFNDRVLLDDNGLDSLNKFDFRDWLLRHGATKESLNSKDTLNSKFLTAVYDLAFAYSEGDRTKPRLAAGVALRGLMRTFFTYRGSMFWRLRSGMGEAVFAPLYKVLNSKPGPKSKRKSKVHFHFLHELTEVGFDDSKQYVNSLKFKTEGDKTELKRLSTDALDAWGCWPDKPGIANPPKSGEKVLSLEGEKDVKEPGPKVERFDAVILAIGIEDFRNALRDPTASDSVIGSALGARWSAMCAHVRTVATKSAQVWLMKDLASLGWTRGSGLITALGPPFDTWADMTQILGTEKRLGGPADAGSLASFCATLPDSIVQSAIDAAMSGTPPGGSGDVRRALAALASAPEADKKAALEKAEDALRSDIVKDLNNLLPTGIRRLWPEIKDDYQAQSEELDRRPQANFEGSDRYTLSEPGLVMHRISPLDRSVENMTIAGDWTACGLDVGCLEAAVMSGLLASHAICKKPALEDIIGYDHP